MGLWRLSAAGVLLQFAPVLCEKSLSPEELLRRLEQKESFSAYFSEEDENLTCKGMPEPVFRLRSEQRKSLQFGSKAKCAMFRRFGQELFRTEFSGERHQLSKWIHTFTSPVVEVQDEATLHEVFLSRKSGNFLDTIVVAFVPVEDKEKLALFNELALRALTEDSISHMLLTEGKTHQQFLAVRNKELAEKMQIIPEAHLGEHSSDLVVFRYHNPESPLGRFSLEDYRPLDQIHGQTFGYLKYHFQYPPGIRQLRLKLLRDKFILRRHSEDKLDYSSLRKAYQPVVAQNVTELATAVAKVMPLILPLVSLKDVTMMLFPMLIDIMRTKKSVLVLSVKEEDPVTVARRLEFRQVAEKFTDRLIPVVTTPRVFSHSHIKHVHLRHQSPVELRLYVMGADEYPTVARQYRFSAPLSSAAPEEIQAWVDSCLAGAQTPHWECEPEKPEERVIAAEHWPAVTASQSAWVWVGDHIPASLRTLGNIYRVPTGVEIPSAKLQPGLYRVENGSMKRMPGF